MVLGVGDLAPSYPLDGEVSSTTLSDPSLCLAYPLYWSLIRSKHKTPSGT